MSTIWGKVIGGVAGFAIGGPIGALMGAFAGHQFDKDKEGATQKGGGRPGTDQRQVAFTIAVVVLSAKMAKADGKVTPDEIAAFKQVFRIPPEEVGEVGRLFNEARKDTTGYEPYAQQIASMFPREPQVLEELLGGLFLIAQADGEVHPKELEYLKNVAAIFGFDQEGFERIHYSFMGEGHVGTQDESYKVLGVSPSADDAEVKSAYRKLLREYHPDALMSKGLPQDFIDLANEKMASINHAYDMVKKERGLN
ncbi:MAG: co-chaperone DjlA [Rhodospirillaceae bacterium]|nr:co-chaperone DjlA [Rhodospirillaceae bacterium]